MTGFCRVLPHRIDDGATNMAIDEALLDSVASGRSGALVRTYEWSEPTLSLGYFQTVAEAEADPRWAAVPWVRRSTGGGALMHDREVTYSVVIPGDHPAARPSIELYRAVHRAIGKSLTEHQFAATRRGDGASRPDSANRPFLCFTDRDAEDIVVGRHKLVGSAQRRRSGAVLQHGSLLLGRSGLTPELLGLSNLKDAPAEPSFWSAILQIILPEALQLSPQGGSFFPEEIQRAATLRAEVHATLDWLRRR